MMNHHHQPEHERMFTCGQHVTGHGRQVAAPRSKARLQPDCVFARGVITRLPGRSGDPYTVLDEKTFYVFEANEEHLTALS